jgi:hypothetical protein
MNNQGNASIAVLVVFFAISVVFISAAAFSGGLIKLTFGITSDYNERTFLSAEAQKVIKLISEDPTPDADSRLDPVWAEVALPSTPGIEITLEDISSRVNPNAAVDILLKGLNLLKPDKLFEEFQKYRMENGPLSDINNSYVDFLADEALEKYCSEYTFFNINTAEENMLYKLFEARTGKKATSTTFPTHLRAIKTKPALVTGKNIKEVLGVDWSSVYPLICAESQWNVNLIDKNMLTAFLAIAKNTYKFELNGDVSVAIMNMRSQTEITEALLPAIVQPKFKGTFLEAYLGSKTWFWKITVARGNLACECIVSRLPPSPGEKEKAPRLRLVEERFKRIQVKNNANDPAENND